MRARPTELGPRTPEIPVFGDALPGVEYVLRPGAYAVLERDGYLALIRTRSGLYLPGGGVETGESLSEALLREIDEECGFRACIGAALGEAVEFVYSRSDATHFRKHGYFFVATLDTTAPPAPPPPELVWIAIAPALAQLTHASQVWAVREYLRRVGAASLR